MSQPRDLARSAGAAHQSGFNTLTVASQSMPPSADPRPLPTDAAVDVSIVMPCLNEAGWLEPCIRQAQEAAAMIASRFGLGVEVVVADNGSTDGSQMIAHGLGARVVAVAERGYGAALQGGFRAARGRFLVMGDADGSYDFRDSVAMIEKLLEGADICMGSRFKGRILPGAMPWKNRYIGNPVLTGILNLLFRTGASDAHCGLRAITKAAFLRLRLTGPGMEFASEMVIKAALTGERFAEVPVTLSPDLRDRPPHLRPWRDGWRHLRYLLMLSPAWLFAAPAAVGATASLTIFALAAMMRATRAPHDVFFGNYWTVLAGAMLGVSHIAAVLAAAAQFYGVRSGYRAYGPWTRRVARSVTLETMLALGGVAAAAGLAVLLGVVAAWSRRSFAPDYDVTPAVAGTLLMTLGAQNVMGGFLLAILNGNAARFLPEPEPEPEPVAGPAVAEA